MPSYFGRITRSKSDRPGGGDLQRFRNNFRSLILILLTAIPWIFTGCARDFSEWSFLVPLSQLEYAGQAPNLTSVSPADGATSVALNSGVTLEFDRSIDPGTLTFNTDNACSGQVQLSTNDFASCVALAAISSASFLNRSFTITPAGTELDSARTFKVKVTTGVKDTYGNALSSNFTMSAGFTTIARSSYIIFLAFTPKSGNLGGATGADAACMADANYPGAGNYRAMLVSNTGSAATNRLACTTANCGTGGITENSNWVLRPSANYTRADTTAIGTTDTSAIFGFNLTNSIAAGPISAWTGLNNDWTAAATSCRNWTDGTGGETGFLGDPSSNTNSAIAQFNSIGCDSPGNSARLYCVQQ